ncbi:MAG: futalosine hydrolase [Humidesulfovibrio sp.]|nr:futalosine hydrolase [Humidesulfovibrio sp.]
MPVLVVAATGLELSAALGVRADLRQGEILETDVFGRRVLALATGIGVVNAALELGRALRPGISGVLNLGVAGSFDLGAHPVGAVRLVERECWPEYGLLATGAVAADVRGLGFALNAVAKAPPADGAEAIFESLAWDAQAALAALGLAAGGWGTASSLTVSGVTADAQRAGALHERFGAGLENMEGFALAYGARRAGLPFAELRAVSNAVGVRPPESWDLPGALSALGQAARRLLAP